MILPRPVYCVTADVHNDRTVADDVRHGRFTHAGITLDLGTEPDWTGAELPADVEWRIEWTKFYYGLDLASAYLATGDIGFLRTWEGLVGSWIRQCRPDADPSDVAARRMQNWTYAWSGFASSPDFPGLRAGLDEVVLDSLTAHVRVVRDHLTSEVFRNHRVLELYALLVVGLAFPELEDAADLSEFASAELHRTLAEGFRPDGVHRENSTHYHLVALRSLLGARENARRFGLDVPDGYDKLLERACDFALHCHRPDGVACALSDADSASYPEVLGLAGTLLGRPDFTYAATSGAAGVAPIDRHVSFPDAGYYFQRSGWAGPDERFLVFDCGPLGDGGHGHYDLLHLEAYAYGQPLVVDPGRYTYADTADRHWFKGTAAHNTVSVDGLDQTPYRRGRPGPDVATGTFLGRSTGTGLDVLAGRAVSPCYDAVHTRRVSFVDDAYWVVEDEMAADTEHGYELRWHLPAEAWGRTSVLDRRVVRSPGLSLVLVSPADGTVRIEPGWIAPSYGNRQPAPVVVAEVRGEDVRFGTLLVPRHPSEGGT